MSQDEKRKFCSTTQKLHNIMLQIFLPNGIIVKVFHVLETRNRQNFKVELNEIL
jgi:hypothetical protein